MSTSPFVPPSAASRKAWPAVLAAAVLATGCGWKSGQQVVERTPRATVVTQTTLQAPARRSAPMLPVRGPAAPRLAEFGKQRASADAHHVANWVTDSDDAEGKSFVIIDKKDARVFLFDPDGKLVASAPALLGAAVGDDAVPGIGEKPLKEVRQEEKTTPAGRYVAEAGVNAGGEDIVWVSYDLAVSMHRVRPLVKAERRLQRLASRTPKDNRISFGCVNLPVAFYENSLRPAVLRTGAIVYVLPETRTPEEQFGSYDVVPQGQLATMGARKRVK
jgi:hypothetical protein